MIQSQNNQTHIETKRLNIDSIIIDNEKSKIFQVSTKTNNKTNTIKSSFDINNQIYLARNEHGEYLNDEYYLSLPDKYKKLEENGYMMEAINQILKDLFKENPDANIKLVLDNKKNLSFQSDFAKEFGFKENINAKSSIPFKNVFSIDQKTFKKTSENRENKIKNSILKDEFCQLKNTNDKLTGKRERDEKYNKEQIESHKYQATLRDTDPKNFLNNTLDTILKNATKDENGRMTVNFPNEEHPRVLPFAAHNDKEANLNENRIEKENYILKILNHNLNKENNKLSKGPSEQMNIESSAEVRQHNHTKLS